MLACVMFEYRKATLVTMHFIGYISIAMVTTFEYITCDERTVIGSLMDKSVYVHKKVKFSLY